MNKDEITIIEGNDLRDLLTLMNVPTKYQQIGKVRVWAAPGGGIKVKIGEGMWTYLLGKQEGKVDRTADGVSIEPGLVCYDNNLDVVVVSDQYHVEHNEREGRDVIWYRLTRMDGSPAGTADGGRLSVTFRDYNGNRYTAPNPIGPVS